MAGSIPAETAKWIKRVVTTGKVPLTTLLSGSSSFGRAPSFQVGGGQFEPGLPLIWILMCKTEEYHRLETYISRTEVWGLTHQLEYRKVPTKASLAQQVEREICNFDVVGSIPTGGSKIFIYEYFYRILPCMCSILFLSVI